MSWEQTSRAGILIRRDACHLAKARAVCDRRKVEHVRTRHRNTGCSCGDGGDDCASASSRRRERRFAEILRPISLPHAMREDAMIVTILRNGDVFFRNDRVWRDKLAGALRVQVERGSERKVYIRADSRTLYRNVRQVLDEIHEAGLVNVSFLVDRRRH
jgi:hypothetical protein